MEIRLRLDDKVDHRVIAEIQKQANGGPVSKALYCIVLEWYFFKQRHFVPKTEEISADPGEISADVGQNGNNYADVLSAIDQKW